MSENQRTLLRNIFPPLGKKLRVHDPFDILEAIFFIVYTGCQWSRLPLGYPPYKTVYYHCRSWSCRRYYSDVLRILVQMKRKGMGQSEEPTMSVIDSHSARTGLPHAVSGIDGGKKIKGIKRQLATDKNGFPLEIITTTANVHDVRGGEKLVASLLNGWNDITLIKADLGYRGMFKECPLSEMDVTLYCVKSNFGTAEFRPIHGRWVVERTFSWLQNYRRMMRNYEQHLLTARAMALLASVFFMLRYFA